MSELTYSYVKGQGWVPGINEYIDIRTNRDKPGVFRFQIWLVGVHRYNYKGWVDFRYMHIYQTEEEVKQEEDKWFNQSKTLIEAGAKHRILWVDNDGQFDVIPDCE